MVAAITWWAITGVLVALELATGTFYLLMLAIGSAAGAVAAHAGLGTNLQMAVGAVVGGAAAFACYLVRRHTAHQRPVASADPNVNLDIGEAVQIESWDPDGTAQVRYRGALWTVVLADGTPRHPGTHRVVEVIGSRLVVEPV